MDAHRQRLRRQQLDRQLAGFTPPSTPTGGWIKALREALGMSLQSFARRMHVTAPSAHQLEEAELNETITVKRLKTAADALGCDVQIVLIPRSPLTQMAEKQAHAKALQRLQRIGHSMSMEDQAVEDEQLKQMVEQTANDILNKGDSTLWD